jgi:DNA-binding beta-propeller fold protein YncE
LKDCLNPRSANPSRRQRLRKEVIGMTSIRRICALGVTCAALIVSMVIGTTAASARPGADVLLSGLSSPKALTLGLDGNPIVGQGAFGPPGPILSYILRGPDRGSTVEILDEASVADIAVGPDGAGWALGTDQTLYRQDPDGTIDAVLDIAAYQQGDPDPVDQEDFPEQTNPYGLTVLPDGDALVADAANNDLLRVTPGGDARTVARFDIEAIGPDDLTAEAVPTTVTVGPDGMAYVGELKGYPFAPGTSHVWRIDPDAEGAFCSVDTPDPDCSVYAEGFTAINDIAFNQRTGRLYVYELAADGVLAFEEGFESGDFPPAVLLKVKAHKRTELAAGQLSQPGGVSVADDGTVFVTDGMFTDGRLLRIRG